MGLLSLFIKFLMINLLFDNILIRFYLVNWCYRGTKKVYVFIIESFHKNPTWIIRNYLRVTFCS